MERTKVDHVAHQHQGWTPPKNRRARRAKDTWYTEYAEALEEVQADLLGADAPADGPDGATAPATSKADLDPQFVRTQKLIVEKDRQLSD